MISFYRTESLINMSYPLEVLLFSFLFLSFISIGSSTVFWFFFWMGFCLFVELGIEPRASGIPGECLTIELYLQLLHKRIFLLVHVQLICLFAGLPVFVLGSDSEGWVGTSYVAQVDFELTILLPLPALQAWTIPDNLCLWWKSSNYLHLN